MRVNPGAGRDASCSAMDGGFTRRREERAGDEELVGLLHRHDSDHLASIHSKKHQSPKDSSSSGPPAAMRTVYLRGIYRRQAMLFFTFLLTFFVLFFLVLDADHWRRIGYKLTERAYQPSDDYDDDEPQDGMHLPKIITIGRDSADLKRGGHKALGAGASMRPNMGQCKIPKLDLNRPEIMKFYKKLPPLNCLSDHTAQNWLSVDDNGIVRATYYGSVDIGVDRMNCSLRYFERITDAKVRWLGWESVDVGTTKITKGDFFKIECHAFQRAWASLFMTPIRNETRVKQLAEIRAKKGINDDSKDWSGLNVYILGFDSLSQMSFRRNMPQTVRYLEKEMGTLVLNGFNIVGDGTPQAFIPFLTGQTEEELPLTRKRYKEAVFVDDVYPFAWANFSDAGYVTAYGEDSYQIGTFSYRLKGFRHQPTDHFVHTFFSHAEKLRECCQCIGPEPMHRIWFTYARRFWQSYADSPRFLLMHHSALSHDDVNKVQLADEDLKKHLEWQFTSGAFNRTMVIVMADHGHRFAKLRETQQGQLEERLPFFSVYFPRELRSNERYRLAYENLVKNARDRLMTHFDMHPTLLDILHWPSTEELGKGHDASKSRTCEQAGVEPHWCTCLSWKPAMNDKEALYTSQLMARSVVQAINEETRPERRLCARLKLAKLLDSKRLVPNESLLKYSGVKDMDGFKPKFNSNVTATMVSYQLRFETQPGGAKYEATLLHNVNQSVVVDLTAISHINAYGDKPHCIINKNYFLATYCVCYDKI